MENVYKAYTKEINGKTFYFVKKFSVYSEFEGSAMLLDHMGMHPNFYKACNLAQIDDEMALSGLMNELHIIPESARVIHMSRVKIPKVKSITNSFLKNTQQAILKFKLASIH